eukprot:6142130-Alexandrium_andersonii.AAC.1
MSYRFIGHPKCSPPDGTLWHVGNAIRYMLCWSLDAPVESAERVQAHGVMNVCDCDAAWDRTPGRGKPSMNRFGIAPYLMQIYGIAIPSIAAGAVE